MDEGALMESFFDTSLWIFLNTHGENILVYGRRVLLSILIILGGIIASRILYRLINRAATGKNKVNENFSYLLTMAVRYGIMIICLILILDTLGVNTTGLITLLGAIGVTIGFALRNTLSNIASGIIILVLHPFYSGDLIECGTISGTVREIGLFTTIMETSDGVYISAPNSNFWGIPLRNFSRNGKRRMDITLSISVSDSIDTAFQVFNNIIQEESRFLKEPAPEVMVQSLTRPGISISLRAWVQSDNYWPVYWDQMKKVKEKMQEAGISIV